jgi:hypothetical protein
MAEADAGMAEQTHEGELVAAVDEEADSEYGGTCAVILYIPY